MGFGSIVSRLFSPVRLEKRVYDPDRISISDVNFQVCYEDITIEKLTKTVESELKTYKSLGYRNKDDEGINNNVYHSYQIGMLLKAYKENVNLTIGKKSDYLPKEIYQLSCETIYFKTHEIIKKYDKEVSKLYEEDALYKEMIWSPLDAGIVLYFLSCYKELEE